jgi:hypothetical protein
MRLAWIALGFLATAQAHATVRLEAADVRDPEDSRLLYRESHFVLGDERWVLYRCPDGRPYARKHVRGGGAAPDFAFEDGRDGTLEGVRSEGGRRTLFLEHRDAVRATSLVVPADAVIDAGFDAAIRARWSQLVSGDVVRLRFLVPSRRSFVPVRVARVGATQWQGKRAERLRMRLDTWFGFAVPDVELVYARADRRLLEFHGTGNVRDARGRNPQVRITFAQPPAETTIDELATMRRLPLDGACRF